MINLLPEKEKIILRRERTYLILFVSLVLFLIGTCIIAIETFFAIKILKDNLSIYSASMINQKEFIEKIKKINFRLITINEIQNQYIRINPILISLAEITPDNTKIKFFSFSGEKKEFKIKGWAKTRKELLEFQSNLEKSEFFKEIEAPLSNLFRQEDIEFEFSGKLNL